MTKKRDILASSRRLKRKRILFRVALGATGFLVLFAAVSALFYISAVRIKNISVSGNSTLESGEIISAASGFLRGKYFGIYPRDNILIFPKEEISAGLAEKFGRIKKVVVEGDFPDSLLINITERKPTALFCGAQPEADSREEDFVCFFIDEDGIVFERAPDFSDNVYVKFYAESEDGVSEKIPEKISGFKKMMKFTEAARRGGVDIMKVVMEKEGLRKFYISEGWYIMLKENDDFQTALENLELALEEKIKDSRKYLEYIDLRFGNKLFYKYK